MTEEKAIYTNDGKSVIMMEVDKATYQLICRLRQLKQPSLVWLEVDGTGTPKAIIGIVPMKRERLGE